MREVISQIRTCPDRRKAIISDLYILHFEGMCILIFKFLFLFFSVIIGIEVVLSKNEEILHAMIESGILQMLVDIMSSDSDPDMLV